MNVAQEALGLNKGEFGKKLGNIVDAHRVGSKLIGKPRDFVLTACRLTTRFAKVANEPNVEARVKNIKAGPRNVKVIVLKREDGFEQPVPRGQLVDQLYPPRKTVRHAKPEKKHAQSVRSAMRTAVDSQLRDYRKTLVYPVTCHHTERIIRRGSRVDIDHIYKPFVQLCDEFVASQNLTYCEVPLVGPPNMKRFKDSTLWRAWQLFHECHARLAPSLPKANRSAGSGTYEASEALIGSFAKLDNEDIDMDF
tara:strand:- start:2290 stop:3042 length:753 start_codon:yes stop_codon:yes gene_type:complete